jgi:hypothetical protein
VAIWTLRHFVLRVVDNVARKKFPYSFEVNFFFFLTKHDNACGLWD